MKTLTKKDKKLHYSYVTNESENEIVYIISRVIVYMFLYLAFSIEYVTFIPLNYVNHIIIVLVGIISVTLLASSAKKKKLQRYLSLFPILGMLATFIFLKPQNIYAGLLGTINYQINRWNVEYDDGRALFQNSLISNRTISYFAIFIAFFAAYIVYLLVKKSKGIPIILMIALYFVPSLIMNNFNSIAFSLAIIAYAASVMSSTKTGDLKRRVIWVVLITAVLLFLSITIGNNQSQYITDLRDRQKQVVNEMRFGTDSLPNGDLSKADKLLADNEKRLEVNSEWAKDIYLKGFVGGKYQAGKWEALPNSSYGGENNGMLKWLSSNNFSSQYQFSSYNSLFKNDSKENKISVKNVGARRNYVYSPYSVLPFGEVNMYQNKDSNLKSASFFGSTDYSYSESSSNIPAEIITLDSWYENPENRKQSDYIKNEKVYRNFVYNSYLSVNSDIYDCINDAFWVGVDDDTKSSILSVTQHIRSYFEEETQYTEMPKTAPKNADPIEWFLTEYKKGNSIYYASAAVEAYRLAGFPARYVEGYLFNNTKPKNETTLLTSQDAHAWVEVYMDGVGWLPIDVTPGYYYDTYALIELVAKPKEVEKTEKNKNNFDEKLKLEEADKNGPSQNNENNKVKEIVSGILTLIFILLVIAFFVVFIILLLRYKKFLNKTKSNDAKTRQSAYCEQIEEMLKVEKIEFVLGKDAINTAKEINIRHSQIDVDEYLRIVELIEKMTYGEMVLEPFEERTLALFCQKYFGILISEMFKRKKKF